MQTPKGSRTSLEVPQRVSPRAARQLKTTVSESDSVSASSQTSRTPRERSPKVAERRSPKERKRPSGISELESATSKRKRKASSMDLEDDTVRKNIALSLDNVSRAIVESAKILASKVARPHPSSAVLFTALHSLNLEQTFLLDCYEYLAKNDADAEMFLGTHESYRDAMLQRIMKNRM